MFVSVAMTLFRNRPSYAVRCAEGAVLLKRFFVCPAFGSTRPVLKTVLIAGRPIWSTAFHWPFDQYVVLPHTPIFVPPIDASGTSITTAFVLRRAKKSVGWSPRMSGPTPKTVPTKPVRSKKKGSLRTPAKTFAPSFAVPIPEPPVHPEPILTPVASDRAFQ